MYENRLYNRLRINAWNIDYDFKMIGKVSIIIERVNTSTLETCLKWNKLQIQHFVSHQQWIILFITVPFFLSFFL